MIDVYAINPKISWLSNHADETVWRRNVSQIRSSPSAELQNRKALSKLLSDEKKLVKMLEVNTRRII